MKVYIRLVMPTLGRTDKSDSIRRFLLQSIKNGRASYIQVATKLFDVSRQTIHRHLTFLCDEGYLVAEGATRARTYKLGHKKYNAELYDLHKIEEDSVYRKDFSFAFDELPDNVKEICHYGFTEMVNNAIDHSNGDTVYIKSTVDDKLVTIDMYDDGEGIFKKIARVLGLPDPRESLLELSKGKLTTDPTNHTGEGIFFTSRAFDNYHIYSGDLVFSHDDCENNDILLHMDKEAKGTYVSMVIGVTSEKDLGGVFDEYSSGPDEFRFNQTVVPVRLALYEGESLVSRSQAKRILNRVERFENVVLDFEGVDSVGQAFADEVFRVFKRAHPEINISAVNTSERVLKMIKRALFSE